MTAARLACWLVLATFPVAIVGVIKYYENREPEPLLWPIVLFVLIPEVSCLMGLLLWATPAVHAELEGKTWLYLAVRPRGKEAVLLGKYMTAVAWSASAGLAGTVVSVLVANPDDPVRLALVLAALVGLSSIAYGAIYVLLGVVFLKRAMVMAVLYTLTVELLLSFVPALVNQLTVQYRLRSLLVQWLEREDLRTDVPFLFSDLPGWQQVLILLGFTVTYLGAAIIVLKSRQLSVTSED